VPNMAAKLISLAHIDGYPLTAAWVADSVTAKENNR